MKDTERETDTRTLARRTNFSIFRNPIHNSIPFLDGRLYVVVEVREGHIEPPFVLISLGIRRGQRFQHCDKPHDLFGGLQNLIEVIIQQRARRRQERIFLSYRRLSHFLTHGAFLSSTVARDFFRFLPRL